MKVLVTGGTGLLGSRLVPRMAAAGHQVSMTEEAFGRTLHVANPDGAGTDSPALWVSARH
jgi:nucleoside-diphosphate-sugar epimerase